MFAPPPVRCVARAAPTRSAPSKPSATPCRQGLGAPRARPPGFETRSHDLCESAAMKLVECVPNFSEGRRPEVIDAICAAIQSVAGVKVIDREMDADHNR